MKKLDYYFPRKDTAKLILENIQVNDAVNMMLFKQRRSGKTSFLTKDLMEEAKNEEYKVFCFYFSFFNQDENFKQNINQYFVSSFLYQLHKFLSVKQKTSEFIQFLKNIGFNFSLSQKNGIEFSIKIEDILPNIKNYSHNYDLNIVFDKFKLLFPEYKLLLLLDEFQELADVKNDNNFIRDLRTAIDIHSSFVKSIFTGSSYNKLMSFFNDYNQPFYNFGFHLKLKDLDDEFIEHLVNVYHHNTGNYNPFVTFELVKEWFLKTGKSPYYVSNALKSLENNIDSLFEEEIMDLIALDENLLLKEQIHIDFWESLNKFERYVLVRILYNQPLFSKDFSFKIANLFNLNEANSLAKIKYSANKLLKTEKIIKENRKYKISDMKLKEFLMSYPETIKHKIF